MPLLDLQSLSAGDRVQHELLVRDRNEKKQANGDPFLVLTLGNSTGEIATAPIWANQMDWAAGAERGRVVQAIGQVGVYQKTGKRQIQLSGPLRIIPHELVDVEAFLPRIDGDPTRLWNWVDKQRAEIESKRLRRLVDLFFADDDFRLRFEKTPGSVSGHHAKIGGLLLHVYEVTHVARQTAKAMGLFASERRPNVDLVVVGALLHDIGKVEAYTIENGAFSYTPSGLLLGHVVLGFQMLERRLAQLGERICSESQLLDVQHTILAHHGKREFGSPVEPMTVEAEIVHWADEASAKANDMMESIDDAEAFASGGEMSDKRVWRVGRRVWRRPHDWE